MGKIEKLFGCLNKEVVDKLPNQSIRRAIASGNYGCDNSFRTFLLNKLNPGLLYLMDPDNDKNIVYWNDKIERGCFSFLDMKEHLSYVGLIDPRNGLHPRDYGFEGGICPVEYNCIECHEMALRAIYRYYKSKDT